MTLIAAGGGAALTSAGSLFLRRALRAVLSAGAPWTAIGAAHAAGAPGRPHLLQLLQLLGRQDLLELGLRLGLQGRQLLLLVGGQVQLLLRARRQRVKPAPSARTTGTTGTPFAGGRTSPPGGGVCCSSAIAADTPSANARIIADFLMLLPFVLTPLRSTACTGLDAVDETVGTEEKLVARDRGRGIEISVIARRAGYGRGV